MSKTGNIWLGIDPGIARIGFGIVKQGTKDTVKVIDYGCITTQAGVPMEDRLKTLYDELCEIIVEHRPNAMAVEKIYFAKNTKTALTVGHARGVILLSAATHGLHLREYTPLQIKQGLTGYGRADKNQIGQMVKSILGLKDVPKLDDTADALAVALIAINANHDLI
jgi:crossover junction endodeoxyribonuclease RuvC